MERRRETTQLKIIMGEIEQDEGEVLLANNVKIGYLTQEFEVKGTNTVREEFLASFGDESEVLKNLERVQKALEDNPSAELTQLLVDKLNELQRQADRMDLFNMERLIDKIMPELGFIPEDNDRLVSSFSGGWQMRISVGKILLQEPGLLLLDEPTNHIDLNTIQWLESYLKTWTFLWCASRTIANFSIKSVTKLLKSNAASRPRIKATTPTIEEKKKRKRCKRTWRGRNGTKKSRDNES